MKSLGVAVTCAVLINVITGYFPVAIAVNQTKILEASFYLIKESEAKPIADREVLLVPCAPVNGNCQDLLKIVEESLSKMTLQSPEKMGLLDTNIKNELKQLTGVQSTRTAIDGTIKTECPTVNCIIYSSVISNSSNTFWIKLQKQGTKVQYLPSSGIELRSASISPQMQELEKSLNNLQARLQTGISYTSLSDVITPFYAALNTAKTSPDSKQYRDTLEACDRIKLQLELLSKVWDAYLQGTTNMGGKTLHLAPAKFVEPLTELFNSVSGYEAIVLYKSKNNFLTSLFGMKDVYKIDNFPSIIMTAISKKVDYALHTYEASSDGGSIPVVDFDGNSQKTDSVIKEERQSIGGSW